LRGRLNDLCVATVISLSVSPTHPGRATCYDNTNCLFWNYDDEWEVAGCWQGHPKGRNISIDVRRPLAPDIATLSPTAFLHAQEKQHGDDGGGGDDDRPVDPSRALLLYIAKVCWC